MFRTSTLALSLVVCCGTATADTIFDLRDTTATVEIENGTITRNGIVASLTPNSGVLNQTGSGFGVNATGSDDTDALDDGNGTSDEITISFNVDVLFEGVALSLFSRDGGGTDHETALLEIASFAPQTLEATDDGNDIYNFGADNLVVAGQAVIISHSNGNGFSFDSFTVSAVPEPTGCLLLASLAFGACLTRKRLD